MCIRDSLSPAHLKWRFLVGKHPVGYDNIIVLILYVGVKLVSQMCIRDSLSTPTQISSSLMISLLSEVSSSGQPRFFLFLYKISASSFIICLLYTSISHHPERENTRPCKAHSCTEASCQRHGFSLRCQKTSPPLQSVR